MTDDLPTNRQTQPGAMRLVAQRVAYLPELFKDDVLVLGADAGTVVGNVDAQCIGLLLKANGDTSGLFVAEFHCIGNEI